MAAEHFWKAEICSTKHLNLIIHTGVGLMYKFYGFWLGGLDEGVRVLVEFFAVESDVVVEVVIDLDASHRSDNNF